MMKRKYLITLTLAFLVVIFVNGCGGKQERPSREKTHSRSATALSSQAKETPRRASAPLASPSPRIIRREVAVTTSPYVIAPAGVMFPAYDDHRTTQPPELLRLDATAFARTTHIFRERAVCTKPLNETTTFTLPQNATQIGLLCRGRAVEDEWPRIRVSLVDAKQKEHRAILFEGNAAWKELRYIWMPIPDDWRGKLVFLRLEILNPNYYFAQRALYVAAVVVSGME